MNTKLTIIIPCFNCESTIEQAVDSCFTQGLLEPFEIIMVDDGSTDNTRELLEKLRNAHSEIRVILHNTNQGGGATRNTAVADAKGQVIFCLDSDDILPDNTLAKMLEYIQTTRSDGVLFAETRFFTSNRPKKFEIVRNSITDRAVVFADLFRQNSGFLTRVNFMFTKNAFLSAGGYPTNHGFDTQTFGVRFLANGQKALVCPNTAYLHRRNSGPSYFMKEYTSGKLSFNGYLSLEDSFYLFSDKTKKEIMIYDIFNNNRLGDRNIEHMLRSLFESMGEKDFFIPNYKDYLNVAGQKRFLNEISLSNRPLDIYMRAFSAYKNNNLSKACDLYRSVVKSYYGSKIFLMNVLRCYMDENHVYEILNMPIPKKNLMAILTRKLNRIFKFQTKK